jgi:hypothetical protein
VKLLRVPVIIQLAVLKRRRSHPRLAVTDRLFWVILRRFWSRWRETLILVQPETVVRWHRAGFKLYWTWLSRPRVRAGRKGVSVELRELIFRMVADNPTWGSPRIHGELKMLGFDISERTVLRWMRKSATEFGSGKAMGGLSEQSSGSHRCNGFLYRADAGVRRALLLLRHRA